MLGKNPTSVQDAITLAQKKDVHSHDSGHEINNINNKQNDNQTTWDPAMLVAAHTL